MSVPRAIYVHSGCEDCPRAAAILNAAVGDSGHSFMFDVCDSNIKAIERISRIPYQVAFMAGGREGAAGALDGNTAARVVRCMLESRKSDLVLVLLRNTPETAAMKARGSAEGRNGTSANDAVDWDVVDAVLLTPWSEVTLRHVLGSIQVDRSARTRRIIEEALLLPSHPSTTPRTSPQACSARALPQSPPPLPETTLTNARMQLQQRRQQPPQRREQQRLHQHWESAAAGPSACETQQGAASQQQAEATLAPTSDLMGVPGHTVPPLTAPSNGAAPSCWRDADAAAAAQAPMAPLPLSGIFPSSAAANGSAWSDGLRLQAPTASWSAQAWREGRPAQQPSPEQSSWPALGLTNDASNWADDRGDDGAEEDEEDEEDAEDEQEEEESGAAQV